jgi:23S rRNA (cytosine1962-C5)-methyltransferase
MRDSANRPTVRLAKGEERHVLAGRPWVFANELDLDAGAKALTPGGIVNLTSAGGQMIGTATFNRHSLIAARLYSPRPDAALDGGFFANRFNHALALRERISAGPYYRLAHAEGDALPGVIVDRFGDVLALQTNTAGAELLLPAILEGLTAALAPAAVVARNDSPARGLEGLGSYVRCVHGALPETVTVEENGCRFPVDLMGGQKTGWFYDLAPARAAVAKLARGGPMLDLYCHTGAFAVQAAVAGADAVLAIDNSEPALALGRAAAALNGVGATCQFHRGEVFFELERMGGGGPKFQTVVADPPSFVKARKDLGPGRRGYRKLARLAAAVVAPDGFLFIASCSHHLASDVFATEVAAGLAAAGRQGRILFAGGAGPDHPVHPWLPETAYIKYQILQLD